MSITELECFVPIIHQRVVGGITSYPLRFLNREYLLAIGVSHTCGESRVRLGIIGDFHNELVMVVRVVCTGLVGILGVTDVTQCVEVPLCILELSVSREVAIVLTNEYNTVDKLHSSLCVRVTLCADRSVREITMVSLCEQGVVGILGRSNVNLDIEQSIRNGSSCQSDLTSTIGILGTITHSQLGDVGRIICAVLVGVITVEAHIDIQVSTCVTIFVRGSTLSRVVAVTGCPVVKCGIAVSMNTLNSCVLNHLFLVLREIRSINLDDFQVRTGFGNELGSECVVLVVNLTLVISLEHCLRVTSISDVVRQNVIIAQHRCVRLHTINMNITVGRTNSDRHSISSILVQTMRCVIQQRSVAGAVFVAHNQSSSFGVLCVNGVDRVIKFDDVVLAVRHIQRISTSTTGHQICRVGIHSETDRCFTSNTRQECCINISYIGYLENCSKCGTRYACILSKQLIVDICFCASLDAEILVAIGIKLITTVNPVKVVGNTHCNTCVLIDPQTAITGVRQTNGVKVKCQVGGDRSDINTQLLNVHNNSHRCVLAGNHEGVVADVVGLICPGISGAGQCLGGHSRTVCCVRYSRRTCCGVKDIVHDVGGVVLSCSNLAVVVISVDTADYRHGRFLVVPNDVLEDVGGLDVHTVDRSCDVTLKQMRTVCLCRQGVRLQCTRSRGDNRVKLNTVQDEMHRLCNGAIRCVCEVHGLVSRVCNLVAESRLQAYIDNLNSPSLHDCTTTVVNDGQGQFLRTNANEVCDIKGIGALDTRTCADNSSAELPSVSTVNFLTVGVGGRITVL